MLTPFPITLLLLVAADPPLQDALVVPDAEVDFVEVIVVPAREAGALTSLAVSEGDRVAAADVIGQIDDRLPRLQKRLAERELAVAAIQSKNDIDLRYAKKSLEVATSELQRSLEAVEAYENSVSQTEVERLGLLKEQSKLSIERAERDLRIAGLNEQAGQDRVQLATMQVEQRVIESPIDGMVVEVYRHPGEWVGPGDPVVKVVRTNVMRVKAFVDGARYSLELKGSAVTFDARVPPENRLEHFTGTVTFVSPEIQPVTRQMLLWAEIEDPSNRLRSGDGGVLRIHLDSKNSPNANKRQGSPPPSESPSRG